VHEGAVARAVAQQDFVGAAYYEAGAAEGGSNEEEEDGDNS
jgi:hypothetical protein